VTFDDVLDFLLLRKVTFDDVFDLIVEGSDIDYLFDDVYDLSLFKRVTFDVDRLDYQKVQRIVTC
jgi:hypothetical protein